MSLKLIFTSFDQLAEDSRKHQEKLAKEATFLF
jgi:hypothetical protein